MPPKLILTSLLRHLFAPLMDELGSDSKQNHTLQSRSDGNVKGLRSRRSWTGALIITTPLPTSHHHKLPIALLQHQMAFGSWHYSPAEMGPSCTNADDSGLFEMAVLVRNRARSQRYWRSQALLIDLTISAFLPQHAARIYPVGCYATTCRCYRFSANLSRPEIPLLS
jgi:hypothetical protein